MRHDLITAAETESRVQYLERNIAEVRTQRSLLQNVSWETAKRRDPELQRLEESMTAELEELQPYRVVPNGPVFVVSYKGNFVRNQAGDDFLYFKDAPEAERWIDAQTSLVAAE